MLMTWENACNLHLPVLVWWSQGTGLLFWMTIGRDFKDKKKMVRVKYKWTPTVAMPCYSFRCISVLLMTSSFAQSLTTLIIRVTFCLLGPAACDRHTRLLIGTSHTHTHTHTRHLEQVSVSCNVVCQRYLVCSLSWPSFCVFFFRLSQKWSGHTLKYSATACLKLLCAEPVMTVILFNSTLM